MKSVVVGLCLVFSFLNVNAQSEKPASQVIEGGKVVIELIKALRTKKDTEKNPGCKGSYADFCILNESSSAITVSLIHRNSGEKREMIIQPRMSECCLQAARGVWTYDLRILTSSQSIRKGDLLIEECENLTMNIKY